jgi:hypothetical protein
VKRVRKILTYHWVCRCNVDVLGPSGGAQDYKVLRVRPDCGNDGFMVWLHHRAPTRLHRFIERLKEHIRVLSITVGHVCKERKRFLKMGVCMVIVPIDNNIYT